MPWFSNGNVVWMPVKDPENWIGVWLNGEFLGYRRAGTLHVRRYLRLAACNLVANALSELFRFISGEDFLSQEAKF